MDLLAMLLWVAAGAGVVAVAVAFARPSLRRPALIVAAMLFLPVGVLGILSIGVVFLAAAATCLAFAFARG